MFYEDKQRWSYTFQNLAYITRLQSIMTSYESASHKYIKLAIFATSFIENELNLFSFIINLSNFGII